MDDEQNYKLIGGDDNKKGDEPTDRETAFLLNDCSAQNNQNRVRCSDTINNNNTSVFDLINSIVNSFDNNNFVSKLIIAALLFHPLTNLIIQDNPTVKKIYTKAQRKLIKRILIAFMFFCLIGFWSTTAPGDNGFISFILKALLIVFLLIHTNILNIANFNETINLWKKILNKKD